MNIQIDKNNIEYYVKNIKEYLEENKTINDQEFKKVISKTKKLLKNSSVN